MCDRMAKFPDHDPGIIPVLVGKLFLSPIPKICESLEWQLPSHYRRERPRIPATGLNADRTMMVLAGPRSSVQASNSRRCFNGNRIWFRNR